MTIKILDHRKGNNIVDFDCDILVNTVNCVGEWPRYNIFERIGCQQRINGQYPLDFFEKE